MKTQEFKDQICLALELSRKKVCCYMSPTGVPHLCDCKYGVTEEKFGKLSEVGNGCPEIWTALKLIKAMNTEEINSLAKRAGLLILLEEDEKKGV